MRFIPTSCLREGMTLSRSLYGKNDNLLLAKDTVLTQQYIDGIIKLNCNGIYIEDNLSKDIEIIETISESLRMETIRSIKNVFIYNPNSIQMVNSDEIKKSIINIVDEIINNKNLMINMIDLKVFDNYTYYHSANVAVLSIVMGVALGLNKDELFKLGLGALLHDIGKVFIDKEIINKNGRLTREEFDEIKKHPGHGFRYVREKFEDIPIHSYVAILDHHEKYDGTGYPNGKKGESISLFGRIVSIADVYDALTSDRPYRKALIPAEAMEYAMGASGSLFDPNIVKVFVKKIAPYPVGTCVKLSNGYTGIVLKNSESCCLRPKVRIFMNNDGAVDTFEIDLKNDRRYINTTIVDTAKI